MALYFFDIVGGNQSHRDEKGVNLASFDDVRQHVGAMIAGLAVEELTERPSSYFHLTVRDDTDFIVFDADLACRTAAND
jgi:hypothetical protein